MQNRLRAPLERAVDSGAAPGFVAAARLRDGSVVQAAAGVRGLDHAVPMTPDTVFWIASLTKAVTTAAALQLVERGILDLDEPVGARLPGLAGPQVIAGFAADGATILHPAQGPITLRHLLSHTSGLAYDFCSDELTRHAGAAGVNLFDGGAPDIPLVFEPGERWQYGIGVDWAGALIQQASGLPLADYMAQNIFAPLGMTDTSFFPGEAQSARKASVHQRQEDGGLAVIPFGMPPQPHFAMGGGGLYATAADYLTFLTAILGGGAVGGARILNPETVALMTTNQVGDIQSGILRSAQPALSNDFDAFPGMDKRWGLGFLINQDPGPAGRSAGSLAWAGLANCYYWADPATGVAGVFMSQVLPFADPRILDAFAAFEAAVYA